MNKRLEILLLIEDNSNDILMIERVINQFDLSITVVTHETAETALEYLMSVLTNPDLILLDLKLPGMNGIEFMRTIHEIKKLKDIPIAIVTGSDPLEISEGHRENASDYIAKPLTPERFSGLLSRLGFQN